MATLQNPFKGINPMMGTAVRESTGQALAGLVATSLQAYGKVKEIDKKFDAEQDAKLGETEMIGHQDYIKERELKRRDNNFYQSSHKEQLEYKKNEISDFETRFKDYNSTWFKSKRGNMFESDNKELARIQENYNKDVYKEFVNSNLPSLMLDPTNTSEDYAQFIKSARGFAPNVTDGEMIGIAVTKLKGIAENIPDEEWTIGKGETLAKGLLGFTKDENVKNEINAVITDRNDKYRNWYSDEYRKENFDLLYNEKGNYNVKEIRAFQKNLDGNDNLTTAAKTSLFQRGESIIKYLKSQAKSASGAFGVNAAIDLSNTLDKNIDTTGLNGKNISEDDFKTLQIKLATIAPYLKPAKYNTLNKKLEQVEVNLKGRDYVNSLIMNVAKGDPSAIAEFQKAKNNGFPLKLNNGYSTNINSSFVNGELSKVTQETDNAILNTYGMVDGKDEKGNDIKVFDQNKFLVDVGGTVNLNKSLDIESKIINDTASDIKTNSALTAKNPVDYYKLILMDRAKKQNSNSWEHADEFRMSRMQLVYDEYQKSTDKDKDSFFLKKMLAVKNQAYVLNTKLDYQANLKATIKDLGKKYTEGTDGSMSWFGGAFDLNKNLDDRSLEAYNTWVNNKGKMFENEEQIAKDMYNNSMSLETKLFSRPDVFFKPDGVDEKEVNAGIEQYLKERPFDGADVDLDDIRIYNTPSANGDIDIVLERNDSNGTQAKVLNSVKIKALSQKNTQKDIADEDDETGRLRREANMKKRPRRN